MLFFREASLGAARIEARNTLTTFRNVTAQIDPQVLAGQPELGDQLPPT
ncbi:MAG: hypothetical protein OEM39_09950 [Acidimicrobiia bacterium]|nr:hypothetical protein [Acidimicrobiia bacterium]